MGKVVGNAGLELTGFTEGARAIKPSNDWFITAQHFDYVFASVDDAALKLLTFKLGSMSETGTLRDQWGV